jgi:hypothetical protein
MQSINEKEEFLKKSLEEKYKRDDLLKNETN